METDSPLPISYAATFVDSKCRYRGKISVYGLREHLPAHGYVIPREKLDHLLLETAAKAGANILQGTGVTGVTASRRKGVEVEAHRGKRRVVHRGRLVVGADGVNSVVAASAGLTARDQRYIGVSQRAYAEGIDGDVGEAALYFDDDFFPGYGWMFPMSRGIVNLGVGILSETAQRFSVNIPNLFDSFFEKLKRSHHRCAKLRLVRPPIGGIVKTYGGAGPNYFDGGLLIGDAGSFVDPMTGEGITPAMESALIAAPVIENALSAGKFDSAFLSSYESRFRAYFDPSMTFLDLCAATMRNKHFSKCWLRIMARGCDLAQRDASFGRNAGAYFGAPETNPSGILAEVWISMLGELAMLGPRGLGTFLKRGLNPIPVAISDMLEWQGSLWKSAFDDPIWHAGWTLDLEKKWLHFLSTTDAIKADPRATGLVEELT